MYTFVNEELSLSYQRNTSALQSVVLLQRKSEMFDVRLDDLYIIHHCFPAQGRSDSFLARLWFGYWPTAFVR